MSNYEPIIEQNNTELQSNNTDLQGLLDTINALPVAENLDDVMDEQDSLIDQIQAALEGKAAASVETCTISFTGGNTFYFNGTTPDGIVTGATYASGTSVTVLKNTMVVIAMRDDALDTYVTGEFITARTTYDVSNTDALYGGWSGGAMSGSGFRMVGVVSNDLTVYANID